MDIRKWFTPSKAAGEGKSTTISPPAAAAASTPASKRIKPDKHAWQSMMQPTPAQHERRVPYLLSFQWPISDYARYPGSGDFAFDMIRNTQDKYSHANADFSACLRKILSNALVLEHLDLRNKILDQVDGEAFDLLATLFYKRNVRWSRCDKLGAQQQQYVVTMVSAKHLADLNLCEISTQGQVACLDLFTMEELRTKCKDKRKPKNKAALVQAVSREPYPSHCVRITAHAFNVLAEMHQSVFCANLLEPEDAHHVIQSFRLFPRTTNQQAHHHEECWKNLKPVLVWLEDMASQVQRGNTNEVYSILNSACEAYGKKCGSCCRGGDGEECALQSKRVDLLHRLILTGISLLEKEKRFGEAVQYLHKVFQLWDSMRCVDLEGTNNPCTKRSVFIAKVVHRLCLDWNAHLGKPNEALELLERVLREDNLILAPHSLLQQDQSRNRLGGVGMTLIQYALRLSQPPRRWNPRIAYVIKDMPEKYITVERQPGKRVEHLALDHYLAEEKFTKGMHCENGIVHTLFGVLFLSPVQTGFNDFCLVHNWRDCLVRLKQASTDELQKLFLESWDAKHPQHLRGVNWQRNSREELALICCGMGAKCLHVICTLLLDAYEAWCGGIGDLLVWHHGKNIVKFVEVKGPGDSLSDRQRAWGEKLMDAGVNIEVCYVMWSKKPACTHEVIELLDD